MVLIGIVVTLVVVFLPKDTKKAVSKVYQAEQTMFLENQTEKALFQSFYGKFAPDNAYKAEAQDIEKIAESLHDMISFYNGYLIYAKTDKTFQSNFKHIVNGIDKANKAQKEMNAILKDVEDFSDKSSTYLKTSWREFREDWVGYLKGYQETIEGLSKVFKVCLPKGEIQNKFTYLVLDTTNDYIDEIIVKFEQLVKTDVKDATTSPSFEKNQGNALSKKFCNFVTTYVTSGMMNNYLYSTALEQDVINIEKFATTYKTSISSVIHSGFEVNANKEITEIWDFDAVAGDTGELAAVKEFLNGGCKA